jgi:electron transfer flavoprotein beta subunit
MEIIVCIKRVPETADADVVITRTGKDIEKGGLVFDINEWDNYAVEEAILLKEKYGGSVTVISMGPEEANETLRRALAMWPWGPIKQSASQTQFLRVPMGTQSPGS